MKVSRCNDEHFNELRCLLYKVFAGVCRDLALSSFMFRGAFVLALGLFSVCSPLAAQQAKHSGTAKHRVAVAAVTPFDGASSLSIYRPKVASASKSILL